MLSTFVSLFLILVVGTSHWSCMDGELEVLMEDEEEENGEITEKNPCSDTIYNHILPKPEEVIDISKYQLVWEDEFEYENSQLSDNWVSQNSSSGHILCSRWRENAEVKNGILELKAKKENRGGQDWTCGSIWTKEKFGYGYYECRYKYAGASGTNNSFWLFPRASNICDDSLACELDINEGHFPNEINTNRHHWENGTSENDQLPFTEGLSPAYAHTFENVISTKSIRFSSYHPSHFHIREFRMYEPNENCYPADLLSENPEREVQGLINLAEDARVSITASGVLRDEFLIASVADENLSSSWVSQKTGEKWLVFSWPFEKRVAHIQFINGWQKGNVWNSLISDYKLEALIDGEWKVITSFDIKSEHNYAEMYHTYGMEWSEDQLNFYFDNQLIRSIPNTECFSTLNIFLSLAVLEYAGEVTDAIDGTSMKVDWVRYYEPK